MVEATLEEMVDDNRDDKNDYKKTLKGYEDNILNDDGKHHKPCDVYRPPNGDNEYPFSLSSIFRRSDLAFLLLMGHKYQIYTFVFDIV